MILDITIPAGAHDLVSVTGDAAGADLEAQAYGPAGFSGAELGGLLLGIDARTVPALQKLVSPVSVAGVLDWRGAIVVTPDGRLGVTLGAGKVLEPAGRVWATVTATETRYVWAGFAPTVTYTMRKPVHSADYLRDEDDMYRGTIATVEPLTAALIGSTAGAVPVTSVLPASSFTVGQTVLVGRVSGGREWVIVTGTGGQRGSKIFTGSGAPSATVAGSAVGDMWIDSVTGDYYLLS